MNKPIYQNENYSFEERAKDLMSRMTLKQKVSQMLHTARAIPELGLSSYNWWNEALHGIARAGVATMFPQAIGMAATFNPDLIEQVAEVISTEGRAKYHEFQRKNDHGIYKGLTFWSPNVNIFRDPRWGRGHETYGEDPYLTGRLGVAYIKGLQGQDPRYLKAAACAKHFAVHSGPEAERHEFDAIVSKKDLYETYLPAFRDCVKEGKVEAIMGAYNRVNGEPCCGSETLLTEILRNEWGFEGHVVSDCGAIQDFHEYHKVTSTPEESAAYAVNHGCDLNCGNMFINLVHSVEQGLIQEETIDQSVIRLMISRMKLGMLDDPAHVPYTNIPYEVNDCEQHREFAVEVAHKTLVLLKNSHKLLPLDRNQLKTISVIGPNADSQSALKGNYSGTASEYVTILNGIKQKVSKETRVLYAEGCHLFDEANDRFSEAISVAERGDVVILCLGLDATLEGEQGDANNMDASGDKNSLKLPGHQEELLRTITALGKPVILVVLSGSALDLSWADEHVPAILQAWYPGAEGGKAVASLLFGEINPSGRLPITFYRSTEELPDFRDYAMQGRTYRYMKQDALYPFGYGLSYSRFEYQEVPIEQQILTVNDSIELQVRVKNNGSMDGEETVQLYIKDVEASVTVPRWQLKKIHKLFLKSGETQLVSFTITPYDLSMINEEGKRILEPGLFEIYIGGNQPDRRSIELTNVPVIRYSLDIVGEAIEMEY
ncbi:glycoside hydrolase family 3 C-terminal domain-containing protein [Paenibacillus marinisediminis]